MHVCNQVHVYVYECRHRRCPHAYVHAPYAHMYAHEIIRLISHTVNVCKLTCCLKSPESSASPVCHQNQQRGERLL